MMASPKARGSAAFARRILIPFGIAGVILVVLGVPQYFSLSEARERAQTLNTDINRLRRENSALQDGARRLREDPEAIEDVARRELGMIRKGEVLFIVKDVKAPGATTPAVPSPTPPKK
jgi:cell division protein FtsB